MIETMKSECVCGQSCVPNKQIRYPAVSINSDLFIEVIDRPCATLADLHARSNLLCLWHCETPDCENIVRAEPRRLEDRVSEGFNVLCRSCAQKLNVTTRKGSERRRFFVNEFPLKASEFVKNLSNPERVITALTLNARDECEWKCGKCQEPFITAVRNRRNPEEDRLGCSRCIKREVALFHIINSPGEKLVDAEPEIAAQFIRLVKYPEITVDQLSAGSNQEAEWLCECGLTFERKVNRVVGRKSIFCETCTTSGKSLFEFEIQELLAASLGRRVEVHHRKGKLPEVDLYLPDFDMAVQLDPYWSHYQRFDNDVRITEELRQAYTHVVRIRQDRLDPIPGNVAPVVHGSEREEWLEKILAVVPAPSERVLSAEETEVALRKANATWLHLMRHAEFLPNSCYAEPWVVEFVENLTHPGKKIEFCTRGSEDRCVWACSFCGEPWEAIVAMRTLGRELGCVDCRRKNRRDLRVGEHAVLMA